MAIKVGGDAGQVEAHLMQHVEGDIVPFTDEELAATSDPARIRKIYRVDLTKHGGTETARRDAEAFVIGSMTLKGS